MLKNSITTIAASGSMFYTRKHKQWGREGEVDITLQVSALRTARSK